MSARCPICRKIVDPATPAATQPFCSERCKLRDLGRWLDGAYQIPVESEDDSDVPLFPPDDPENPDR